MNPLLKYLKENENWETTLSEEPYNLRIAKDDDFPDLRLFKYNQVKSDMSNAIVQVSRGIIIDVKNMEIVCHPFDKFFNYNEPNAHEIDWNSARVLEKVDGSIIKLYHYKDEWKVATNGCINAYKTNLPTPGPNGLDSFGKLLDAAMMSTLYPIEAIVLNTDNTYIFEITSPYNRVVVPHKDISLTHIGTRNNKTGEELNIDLTIKKPKEYTFNSFEDILENSKALPFDEEGYVVVDKNWNRVKIKSLAYVQVHHLADNGNISKNRILELIKIGEDSELLEYYPEYKDLFEEVREEYLLHLNVLEGIKETTDAWNKKYKDNQKGFAIKVTIETEKQTHAYFFAYRNNKQETIEKLNSKLTYDKLLKKIFIEEK